MTDIESVPRRRRQGRTAAAPSNVDNDSPPTRDLLPPRHPLNVMKRCAIIFGCLYLLHFHFELQDVVLNSPRIRHGWLKLGLATSVAILAIKSYVETFASKQKKVVYDNFKSTTHAVILLLFFSGICFTLALWDEYGFFKSCVILNLILFGIILQVALFLPNSIQNLIGAIVLTWMLQMYI